MGEIKISPILNVHDKYNRVNIINPYRYDSGGGGGIDPDYQDILNFASAQSFALPPQSVQVAQNILISELKNIGVYQKADTIANFAVGFVGFDPFSLIDIKKKNVSYTLFGSPHKEPSGLRGYNSAIETNHIPGMSSNQQLGNAGRMAVMYSVENTLERSYIGGMKGSLTKEAMYAFDTAAQRVNSSTSLDASVDMSGTGLKSINRDSASQNRLYNKNVEYLRTSPEDNVPAQMTELLRRSTNLMYSASGISFYYQGGSLTATQVANFRIAYNNYLLAIGLTAFA